MNERNVQIRSRDKTTNIFPVTKSKLVIDLDEKLEAAKNYVDNHVDNKNNPHSVTAEQVGAYSKTESDDKYETPTGAQAKATIVQNDLNSHKGTTGVAHGVATQTVNGFMSNSDKIKLDSIETNSNKTILNNTVTSTNTSEAATANAVKIAYDKAVTAQTTADTKLDKTANAVSASKLVTARSISLSGDATGTTSFDGPANASMIVTLKNSGVAAGTYTKLTVDSKGIVTSASHITVDDVKGLLTNGKITEGLLPSLNITDVYEVSSQTAMLALTAQQGDIAVRSDLNKSYILKALPATTLLNWVELKTPTDVVLSVNGKIGAVTLTKSDVNLGNVDNTSDLNKPISMATQVALDSKAGNTLVSTSVDGLMSKNDKSKLDKIVKGTTAPKVAGTAVAGTSDQYSPIDHVHPVQTTITGNAGTATKLAASRKINGISFDGTSDITITADPTVTSIPTGADLNNYTNAGMYQAATNAVASTILNSPVTIAFSLLVEKHNGVKQTVTTYSLSSQKIYTRNSNSSGSWGSWVEMPLSNGTLQSNLRVEKADQLTTARTISLTGDAVGSVNFDGSGNVTIVTTVPNKVNKSGDSMTGDLKNTGHFVSGPSTNYASVENGVVAILNNTGTNPVLRMSTGNGWKSVLQTYAAADTTGDAVALGAGGLTVIGGGEAGTNFLNNIKTAITDGTATPYSLNMGSEDSVMIADSAIRFISRYQTPTNAKMIMMNYNKLIFETAANGDGILFLKTGKTAGSLTQADYDSIWAKDGIAYVNAAEIATLDANRKIAVANLSAATTAVAGTLSAIDKAKLDGIEAGANKTPAGTVSTFAGATIPTGWLLADGRAVSRTTYSALFSAISTTYGAGDGSTTFNLPNLTNKTIFGKGTETEFNTLGKTGGSKTQSYDAGTITANIGAVNESINALGYDAVMPVKTKYIMGVSATTLGVSNNVNHATSTSGRTAAENNLPPYVTMNYIIKY